MLPSLALMATTFARQEHNYDAFIVNTTHSYIMWKHGWGLWCSALRVYCMLTKQNRVLLTYLHVHNSIEKKQQQNNEMPIS